MNEVLRDAYVEDCEQAVERWNKHLDGTGLKLTLPSRNASTGPRASSPGDTSRPRGRQLSPAEYAAGEAQWLPSEADRAYVQLADGEAGASSPGTSPAGSRRPPAESTASRSSFEYVRYNEG